MINVFMLLLEGLLRILGIFWIVGGLITFKMAREANFIDSAIESLTQEKEDKLLTCSTRIEFGGFSKPKFRAT